MATLAGNSIVEKARSFARLLASTREFQRLYAFEETLKRDEEASALLRRFAKIQYEVWDVQRRGEKVGSGLSAELQRLQRELAANVVIVDWDRGRYEAIDLIQAVGQVISDAAGVDLAQSPPRCGCGT
jgi:cell fate (sporulation/competence/biofilm development) regulator YlbF (YheA/YmcA/DUF963 family)